MRDRLLMLTVALLLVSRPGVAQTPPAPQTQAPVPTTPLSGSVDVGSLLHDDQGRSGAIRTVS